MPVINYKTPLGLAQITEEESFITSIHITDADGVTDAPQNDVQETVIKQMDEYFAGQRQTFDLPLRQAGTLFQQEVWNNLQLIEYGTTISYMQLSKRMGNPLAIRAIAAANGKNNLWIVVPCHRVIGSDGSLTGYAGGLWRKQWLLEHEARVCGVGQYQLDF